MDFATNHSRRPSMRRAALAVVLVAMAVAPAVPQTHHAQPKKPQKRDLSQGNTLYVVPYAHLDTQWRWAYPQVIREYIASTLHDNFALIDKYPTYVFNFSGSRRYEMMKEYYPAEYERLKGYIKDGRWFPCGSSVDEGDANVPSGESLIRHVLYGNRYFRQEFGVASQEFMLPDCFGFPYALPSILAHCGLQGFSTQKLTWGSSVGIPFKVGRWIGPDGRSVVAALDPGAYAADVSEDLSVNTSWLARIQNTGKQSGAFVDYHYYGTGDRGGAPTESSVQWVEKSVKGSGPIKVVSSRADEMFTSLTPAQIAKLPEYRGELLLTEHSAGSITSQAYMKRWNRKSELLADAAERASVGAMWLGGAPYPSKRLYNAWDLVLGSQMHDMLPGTSIPKAYEFCWNDYLISQNQFAAIEQDGVGAIASAMDTRGNGTPLVVFNPLSIDRQDVVEANVPFFDEPLSDLQVVGPDGVNVPTQTLGSDASGTRILFLAKVPANGLASFSVRRKGAGKATAAQGQATTSQIENARFKVSINKAGDIAGIYDKLNKREVLKSPARLDLQYHNPSAFPAWNMDWADAQKPPRGYVDGVATMRVIENGPVRWAIEVDREKDGSRFVQQIRLSAGDTGDRVEVLNKIDWQTKETALKASFPLTVSNPKTTYDLQLGAVERGVNDPKKYEVPQHQWFDQTKSDGSYGVAILNDSKFGSDKPSENTLRLTLIYTPGVRSGFADQATQDFGRHQILYAIAPHAGDWRKANIPWAAKRLNQPLRAFVAPAHAGALGKSFSLLSSSSRQVEISAVKKAEDGNEVVIRLRELHGRPANGVAIRAASGIVSARELNGQEMPIGGATVRNGALVTDVRAFSYRTFAVKLGAPKARAAAMQSKPVELPFDTDVASSDGNRSDGGFDRAGRTIAAEMLPATLTVDGVGFRLGSTKDGAKNAVAARGQKIAIPAGFSRVYLLMASEADTVAPFKVGAQTMPAKVDNWGGYVGQWDNRLWAGDLGPNFTNYGDMAGLVPGYVKEGEIAWFASHRHHPTGGNEHYQYSYLFKHGFDIPKGATSLTLPNDPRIKVFAVSVAKGGHDATQAAGALYDDLREHEVNGHASISPSGGGFNDTIAVTVTPPLYWRAGGLRYTLDGSIPTPSSPVYTGPIVVSDPTTITVAEFDSHGVSSMPVEAKLDVRDTTPPRVLSAESPKVLGIAKVRFSERVTRQSAENPSAYRFESGATVTAAKLSADQRTVELTLDHPLAAGRAETLTVDGVRDLSKAGNPVSAASIPIGEKGAVFTSPALEPKTTKTFQAENLPVKAADTWTLNLWCRIDEQPEDRVIIAGFGRAVDGRSGTGRYFTKFARGINFWSSNRDVMTNVPLDLGKWQMLTATYDGTTLRVYKNGDLIGERQVELSNDQGRVNVMPLDAWERQRKFNGEVRDLTVWDLDLSPSAIKRLWEAGKGA